MLKKILISVLMLGLFNQEIYAIKNQTWGLITAGGIVAGATAVAITYHLSKKQDHKPKTLFKKIIEYLGVSTLGGIAGGLFTGIPAYFFTPGYRFGVAKRYIDALQKSSIITQPMNPHNLTHHINATYMQDYPMLFACNDLINQKQAIEYAQRCLANAKRDTNDATLLRDMQQYETTINQMLASATHHIAILRTDNVCKAQIQQELHNRNESIRLHNQTKYANAAERSSHAMQTSANAQTMHGVADLTRTVRDLLR
jgi:hypothetical protein